MRTTKFIRAAAGVCAAAVLAAMIAGAQQPAATDAAKEAPKGEKEKGKRQRVPPPGVSTPGVRRDMAAIKPIAEFPVPGTPDWQTATEDAVWVSNGPRNTLHRMDIETNTLSEPIAVGQRPCSGLAAGFGSIWVPNCGDKTMSRVDTTTLKQVAVIPVGPAASEGLVAASEEAVWMATDLENGTLVRIDPNTNSVAAEIDIAPGSAGVAYGEGFVWVTSPQESVLTKVDPNTNQVVAVIPVGKTPRFMTTGDGSAWTVNQGDGTVSRVDAKTNEVITIQAGAPGGGGGVGFGGGYLWFTLFEMPITQIDAKTNQVVKQWFGPGGDYIQYAHGSLWLSNLRQQNVWRIDPDQP